MKTDYCVYVHVSPNGKHYVRQTGVKFWKRWGPNKKLLGHSVSEETRKKISEKTNGRKGVISTLGMHWYTDGVNDILTYDCPERYHKGRTNNVGRFRNEKGQWIHDNTEVNNGIA